MLTEVVGFVALEIFTALVVEKYTSLLLEVMVTGALLPMLLALIVSWSLAITIRPLVLVTNTSPVTDNVLFGLVV